MLYKVSQVKTTLELRCVGDSDAVFKVVPLQNFTVGSLQIFSSGIYLRIKSDQSNNFATTGFSIKLSFSAGLLVKFQLQ